MCRKVWLSSVDHLVRLLSESGSLVYPLEVRVGNCGGGRELRYLDDGGGGPVVVGFIGGRLGGAGDSVVIAEDGRKSWNEVSFERADDFVRLLAESVEFDKLSSDTNTTGELWEVKILISLTIWSESTRPSFLEGPLRAIHWPEYAVCIPWFGLVQDSGRSISEEVSL